MVADLASERAKPTALKALSVSRINCSTSFDQAVLVSGKRQIVVESVAPPSSILLLCDSCVGVFNPSSGSNSNASKRSKVDNCAALPVGSVSDCLLDEALKVLPGGVGNRSNVVVGAFFLRELFRGTRMRHPASRHEIGDSGVHADADALRPDKDCAVDVLHS